MNDVIKQISGFFNISICDNDTDFLYIHKKYWSSLVDNGFVGKSIVLGKNDYGTFGIFYA